MCNMTGTVYPAHRRVQHIYILGEQISQMGEAPGGYHSIVATGSGCEASKVHVQLRTWGSGQGKFGWGAHSSVEQRRGPADSSKVHPHVGARKSG